MFLWVASGWLPRPALGTVRGIVQIPDTSDWSGSVVTVIGRNISATTDNMGHYELAGVPAGPVRIQAGKLYYGNAFHDTVLSDGGTLVLNLVLGAAVVDTFTGISSGQITSGTTNVGNLGVPNRFIEAGDSGFTWAGQQQLLEASLMIGTDTTHVSDAARFIFGIAQDNLDHDFQSRSDILVLSAGPDSVVERTVFDDSRSNMPPGNPSQPLNVLVTQTTSCYGEPGEQGYMIVGLDIRNTSRFVIRNLLVGWFVDWNAGGSGATNRGGVIFPDQQIPGFNDGTPFTVEIAYQRGSAAAGPFVGVLPLSQAQFRASRIASVQGEIVPTAPGGGLREANKYVWMRDRRSSATYTDHGIEEDLATIVSVGGLDGKDYGSSMITIPAGGEVTVGFAFIGGNDSLELIANGLKAQKRWQESGNAFRLLQNTWNVDSGWNIVSLPLTTTVSAASALFPSALSAAYEFTDTTYTMRDSLRPGVGYWMKFPSQQAVTFAGSFRRVDSISVASGWNLIGTLSFPVASAVVTSVPPGIISSGFFTYTSGYALADTLFPLKGYWVKTGQKGKIILRSGL